MSNLRSKKGLMIGVAIFFLAFIVRAVYLYESSASPSFDMVTVDSASYDSIARSLVSGQPMSDKFFWQPFFYPFFVSVVYFLSGSSMLCVKVLQIALGSVSCVLSYKLARKLFGLGAGVIAGVITILYAPLIFFDAELLAVSWAGFWAILLITLLVRFPESKKRGFGLMLGLCAGLSVITRPTFLPFLFISLIWIIRVLRRRGSVKIVGNIIIMLAGFAIITVPVAFQNYRVTGHFKLLPSSGGINFYIGNNPETAETLTARPGWDWQRIDALPEQHGFDGDLYEQQRYFKKEVLSYISSSPLDFCKGLVRKTVQFVNSREIPRNVDIYTSRQWSGLLGFLSWKIGGFGFPFGLLLPLTVIGLVSNYKKTPAPVLWFLLLYPASIVLVFVSARYRAPVIPVMAVLAAPGLLSLIKTVHQRNPKPMLFGIAVIIALVLLSSAPGPFPEEKINFEAELYRTVAVGHAKNGDIETAFEYLNKALMIDASDPSVHFDIAWMYAKTGKSKKAIHHYQRSLELKPDQFQTHNNLALVLSKNEMLKDAEHHFKKAVALNPGDVNIRNNLGVAYLKQKKFDPAVEQFKKILKLDPAYANAWYNIALVMQSQGKFAEAVKNFQEAIELKPDNYQAYDDLAMTYERLGKNEAAIESYKESLRIKPDYLNANYNLGALYYRTSKIAMSVKYWKLTVEIKPDLLEIHKNLAWILSTSKDTTVFDPAAAVKYAKHACKLTDYRQPQFLDTLSIAYAGSGEFDLAIQTAQKAVKLAENTGNAALLQNINQHLTWYRSRIAPREAIE